VNWLSWVLGGYALIAVTVMFLSWPYAETGKVSRWVVVRDSLGWLFWALLLIVEATEEARRTIRDRVE